jgi:DNA-binding CsgD family transcriptional regulator
MNSTYKTAEELKHTTNQQVFSLEKDLARGYFSLNGIGDLIPGSIMVHDMQALRVSYINNWGCEGLKHSMEEINEMGAAYFDKFLVPEETSRIIPEIAAYFKEESHTAPYGFFQQVRTGPNMELNWHYTSCKFLRDDTGKRSSQLILVSNPVAGMGLMVNKVNKLLDENVYVARNYKKFMLLTKREKEIITLLADGKTTSNISDMLFISHHTVSTHRKNIGNKLEIYSFSELLKFAAAFELI